MLSLHNFEDTLAFSARHNLDLGPFNSPQVLRDLGSPTPGGSSMGHGVAVTLTITMAVKKSKSPGLSDQAAFRYHALGCRLHRPDTVRDCEPVEDRRVGACAVCNPADRAAFSWEEVLVTADTLAVAEADPATVRATKATLTRLGEIYRVDTGGGLPDVTILSGCNRESGDRSDSVRRLREIATDSLAAHAAKHRHAATATRVYRETVLKAAGTELGSKLVYAPPRGGWDRGMPQWVHGGGCLLAEGNTVAETPHASLVAVPADIADTIRFGPHIPVDADPTTDPQLLTQALTVFNPAAGATFDEILAAVAAA